MKKDTGVYLQDIIDSCKKIEEYINAKSEKEFEVDSELQDAVLRRLTIIGEAIKRLPQEIRDKNSGIEWKKAMGMRDILVHHYDEVELEQVWNTITKILPPFKKQIQNLFSNLK